MDINVLLFDDFETLDVFGPVEILGQIEEYKLCYYSTQGGLIRSAQNTLVMTEPLNHAASNSILLIPGGRGTRALVRDEDFLNHLKKAANDSVYCLCVCTGSGLLAKTGLLKQVQATSNKKAFDWVVSLDSEVNWIKEARWVVDGKYYTSSGVSAGMDMALGFIKDRFGLEKAFDIAKHIEYVWNRDSTKDDFAV